MSAALTRRALVQTASAAIGATVVGISTPASAETGMPVSGLDAEWSALLDRRREAAATWEATDVPLAEALARAKAAYPPRPAALRTVFLDIAECVAKARSASGREPLPDGRMRAFYTVGDVEALRVTGPITVPAWGDDGDPLPDVPSPAGERRRQEIIQAHDAWAVECRAVEDAVGYTAACEAEDATGQAYFEADEAVELYQPVTVAGLVAKGAWVAERVSRPGFIGDLGAAFARQVAAFGGVAP